MGGWTIHRSHLSIIVTISMATKQRTFPLVGRSTVSSRVGLVITWSTCVTLERGRGDTLLWWVQIDNLHTVVGALNSYQSWSSKFIQQGTKYTQSMSSQLWWTAYPPHLSIKHTVSMATNNGTIHLSMMGRRDKQEATAMSTSVNGAWSSRASSPVRRGH